MNRFEISKGSKPRKNNFDLSHVVNMSAKMGELLPCMVMEVIPGDRVHLSSDMLARLAPTIAPIMSRVDVRIEYFMCPDRLIWPNFEKFIVGVTTGGIPTITVSGALTADQQKFLSYFGIPKWSDNAGTTAKDISALPLMAYQKIYNDWYRDENLIAELTTNLADGNQAVGILATLRKRAWEHDYFTACLPFAQKGTAVSLPLGDISLDLPMGATAPRFVDDFGAPAAGPLSQNGANEIEVAALPKYAYDPQNTLKVTPTTINDLRRAEALQKWLERNALGGTRYTEFIQAHFGERTADYRLQRPEYIVGAKNPVIISEVLNTNAGNPADPGFREQGSMAGHGVSAGAGSLGTYSVREHGYIIGIVSVMPKTQYQNGIPRTFLKTDPTDFYFPEFAHLGEQVVPEEEVFAYRASHSNTFGYMERYAEYKYLPSRVAGDFTNNLNFWHLGRIFTNPPSLNQSFIECDPANVSRAFAVTAGGYDNIYLQVLNRVMASRPMPVFGVPQL